MLKYEFEERVRNLKTSAVKEGHEVTFTIPDREYQIIQHVYNYYPGLDKEAAARLYVDFGLRIFEDMTPRADKIADLEQKIGNCRTLSLQYQEEIDKL